MPAPPAWGVSCTALCLVPPFASLTRPRRSAKKTQVPVSVERAYFCCGGGGGGGASNTWAQSLFPLEECSLSSDIRMQLEQRRDSLRDIQIPAAGCCRRVGRAVRPDQQSKFRSADVCRDLCRLLQEYKETDFAPDQELQHLSETSGPQLLLSTTAGCCRSTRRRTLRRTRNSFPTSSSRSVPRTPPARCAFQNPA